MGTQEAEENLSIMPPWTAPIELQSNKTPVQIAVEQRRAKYRSKRIDRGEPDKVSSIEFRDNMTGLLETCERYGTFEDRVISHKHSPRTPVRRVRAEEPLSASKSAPNLKA